MLGRKYGLWPTAPANGWILRRYLGLNGRSERIRTSDPLVPNEVRYQTALHSDSRAAQRDAGLIDGPFGPRKGRDRPARRFGGRGGKSPAFAVQGSARRAASGKTRAGRLQPVKPRIMVPPPEEGCAAQTARWGVAKR